MTTIINLPTPCTSSTLKGWSSRIFRSLARGKNELCGASYEKERGNWNRSDEPGEIIIVKNG
jgi:hypothetical protein